jgi:hypothetical protein
MNNYNSWFNYAQGNFIQRVAYDANSNAEYIGWAAPGTATSDSKWRIIKNTYDVSNRFTGSGFPSGSPAFTYVWDSRAGYTFL